jgi:hypothetical protein
MIIRDDKPRYKKIRIDTLYDDAPFFVNCYKEGNKWECEVSFGVYVIHDFVINSGKIDYSFVAKEIIKLIFSLLHRSKNLMDYYAE